MKTRTPVKKLAHSIVKLLTKYNPSHQETLALCIEYKRVIERLHNALTNAGYQQGKDFQLTEGSCMWFGGDVVREFTQNLEIKQIYESLIYLIGRIDKFQAKASGKSFRQKLQGRC